MNVYYAHPMSYYGTTAEADDIAAIEDKFPGVHVHIENPNQPEWQARAQAAKHAGYTGMEPFLEYVAKEADVVVFRAMSDGFITAGVAKEILEAHFWGKPIYRVVGGSTEKGGTEPYIVRVEPPHASRFLTVPETKLRVSRGDL